MNPPISDIFDVPFRKHCMYSLVNMKNRSFHLENLFSLCCHKTPLSNEVVVGIAEIAVASTVVLLFDPP